MGFPQIPYTCKPRQKYHTYHPPVPAGEYNLSFRGKNSAQGREFKKKEKKEEKKREKEKGEKKGKEKRKEKGSNYISFLVCISKY